MEDKCQFCGSDKKRVETPFVALGNSGEYEKQYDWCCQAQKQNNRYGKSHLDAQTREPIFSEEEISKA